MVLFFVEVFVQKLLCQTGLRNLKTRILGKVFLTAESLRLAIKVIKSFYQRRIGAKFLCLIHSIFSIKTAKHQKLGAILFNRQWNDTAKSAWASLALKADFDPAVLQIHSVKFVDSVLLGCRDFVIELHPAETVNIAVLGDLECH